MLCQESREAQLSPKAGERRQCPKTSISSPITAKPDHERKEISYDREEKKWLTLGCKRGERKGEEKTPKAVNNLN